MINQQIKEWFKDNWFKVISSIVLLVIGFSFFYYFFLRAYQKDIPYRECINQISSRDSFSAVRTRYLKCVEQFSR